MAQNHEDAVVELHSSLQQRTGSIGSEHKTGMTGEKLPSVEHEKGDVLDAEHQHEQTPDEAEPNEYEKHNLRHVGENLPAAAFLIAIVELCERFTCESAVPFLPIYSVHASGKGHEYAFGHGLKFESIC